MDVMYVAAMHVLPEKDAVRPIGEGQMLEIDGFGLVALDKDPNGFPVLHIVGERGASILYPHNMRWSAMPGRPSVGLFASDEEARRAMVREKKAAVPVAYGVDNASVQRRPDSQGLDWDCQGNRGYSPFDWYDEFLMV